MFGLAGGAIIVPVIVISWHLTEKVGINGVVGFRGSGCVRNACYKKWHRYCDVTGLGRKLFSPVFSVGNWWAIHGHGLSKSQTSRIREEKLRWKKEIRDQK